MSARMIRRCAAAVALCFAINLFASADDDAGAKPKRPFFAFDNGTGRGVVPLEDQARMLKELGYDGIGYTGLTKIPEMLKALDAQGMKMFTVYSSMSVDPDKPPYAPELKTAIEQLKGRDTIIWLNVLGGRPSSDAEDERAVAVVGEIADLAAAAGLRVAFYPHVNNYVERVEDGLRLIEKAKRKNLGVAFNLCHFLKTDDEKNLDACIRAAAPHLFLVNINGADSGDTRKMSWDRLIQRLDSGSFDLGRLLKTLDEVNYTGPVCLQSYLVPGDMRENLARSIAAWRKLHSRRGSDN
ncbi:MAG: sugar phosphate isomerase/epimerase [Pirellulaceae bacterium]|nr:sugar phosphate isomerase/epimerase [Pirellulaceae bacterium]